MKKIISLFVVFALCAVLSACGANPKCEYDAAVGALSESEEVYSYVYSEGKGYNLEGEALAEMISGEWVKSARPKNMEKVVSFTIGTQYEICIFEGGNAIIYCGYASVLESDRKYYSTQLADELEDICQYVSENGEEVVIEE